MFLNATSAASDSIVQRCSAASDGAAVKYLETFKCKLLILRHQNYWFALVEQIKLHSANSQPHYKPTALRWLSALEQRCGTYNLLIVAAAQPISIVNQHSQSVQAGGRVGGRACQTHISMQDNLMMNWSLGCAAMCANNCFIASRTTPDHQQQQ